MDESEDNLSSEDLKYDDGTSNVKVKPKKRSLVERELETNLTARVTSPITNGDATSTSRYGRARRLKMENDKDVEKPVTKSLVSPKVEKSPTNVQSPVYKMHASNSPIRVETPKRSLDNQIENIYSENISLSRFGSEEKCKSSTKKHPKVYIRKDLIQTKDKDSDDTVVLIKNMFSPSNSSKYNCTESSKKPNGHINSVVKTLDFDGSKKKKNVEKKTQSALSKSELFEMEAKCEYQVGDLAWARMGTYPFWPCIITRDPLSEMFVKKKLFGRVEHDVLHVTFFGDNGRRGWIVDNMLRKFLGQLEFEVTRMNFTPEAKKKDPKLYSAFFISEKKTSLWQVSVEEAETLLREPKRLRIDILNDMLEKSRVKKSTPQHQKSKKVTRTNSDVSLSESLYDTLFSPDDSKANVSERSRSKSRNRSLNVSEVVTACLDNMAAKTGITKIQRQSHMDRWLQKAKSKTPEKSHGKSQGSSKISSGAKSKKKLAQGTPTKTHHRKSSQESQTEDEDKLQCHQNEHDYTQKYCDRNSPVIMDDVEIEYENAEMVTTDSLEPGSGIGIISKVETLSGNESLDNNEDMILTVIDDEIIITDTDNIDSEICIQSNQQLPNNDETVLQEPNDKLDTDNEVIQKESHHDKELESMEIDDESNKANNEHTSESAINVNIIKKNKEIINFTCDESSADEESMDVSDLHTEIECNNMNNIFNNDFELTNTICIPSSDNKTTDTTNEERNTHIDNTGIEGLSDKAQQYDLDNEQVSNIGLDNVSNEVLSDSPAIHTAQDNNLDPKTVKEKHNVEIDTNIISFENRDNFKDVELNNAIEDLNNKKNFNESVDNKSIETEECESVASELDGEMNNEKITENGFSEEDISNNSDDDRSKIDSNSLNQKSKVIGKFKLSLNKSIEKKITVINDLSTDKSIPELQNANITPSSIEIDSSKVDSQNDKNDLTKDSDVKLLDNIVDKTDLNECLSIEKHSEDSKISDNIENIVNNEVENIENMSIDNSSNNIIEDLQKESLPVLLNGYHEDDVAQTNNIEPLQNEPSDQINQEQKSNENNIKKAENIVDINVIEKSEVVKDEIELDRVSVKSEDSEVSVGRKKRAKDKDKGNNFEDPEFLKYLELRQDAVMDEHPELSQKDITNYLYKTWLYEENLKTDTKKADDIDHVNLVKGLNQDTVPVKKIRKKIKVDKEKDKVQNLDSDDNIQKEKSKRKIIRPYYKEDFSDAEEDIQYFDIFKPKLSKSVESLKESVKTEGYQDITTEVPIEYDEVMEQDEIDLVEEYFSQLTATKPNVFKGLMRERVCEICERVGNLVKCKACHNMFHVECDKKQIEVVEVSTPVRGRKKKKKNRGRKAKEDGNSLDSESQSDEKSQDANVSEEIQNTSIDEEESHIIANADEFEAQLSEKMKEILENPENLEYDSGSNDELDWNDINAGECKVVDIKLKTKDKDENLNYSDFKCTNCEKYDIPICFVCKNAVSPKNKIEQRQRCQVAHCQKYYHLECLDHWPQTQFNAGELSRTNKGNTFTEALSCPRHVCHTCVCDDPRGCKTRFSGDKLARCVRCPATYHTFTKCLPAGSQILTGSHIICPRHYEHRPGKVPCHVNTGWCFICALGGSLICCEYCPTSFHAECLNIKPPEGGYMCEDCETGRLPLYGEMVWVKLGHYRWWPGIILHPSEIPNNIMAVKHSPGEFVVRFFGQYDHYWVNRGRVFPFQEGDSGKVSSQKSKIDAAFTMAMEHAQRACEILKTASPNEEESIDIASSLLPPHYVKLRVNRPCGSLCGRRVDLEEGSLTQCECDPSEAEPCGLYTQCLNRMLLTECGPTCRAGDRCNNRAFEKRLYPKMVPYRTPHRGWGLKTLVDIKAGQFVIEYVGELIDEEEFRRRMSRKHEVRDENFYFLTLDKERMIDAGPKGNLARFMNHSCEPNCETQKWTVLGDIRVGLFALYDIPANSELTFNYNLESTGIEKKQCMCGAKRCSGYIGAKPKQDEQPKKIKVATKRTYKKRKQIDDSPTSNKPKNRVGRPYKPRELTEIEKDLLIIKNATNGMSSDSECSGRVSSIDSAKDSKALKRKRTNLSTDEILLSPSTKRLKNDNLKLTEFDV